MARCWLVGDHSGRFPLLAAQFARLKNLPADFCAVEAGALPAAPPPPNTLIALSFDRLARLAAGPRLVLKDWVGRGATLYVRGGIEPGSAVSLAPFVNASFVLASEQHASSYRFPQNSLTPDALAGEEERGGFLIPGASGLEPPAEPLLMARQVDGCERPAVFAIRCGDGVVICDLHSDENFSEGSIGLRLEDPAEMAAIIGALIAANHATGRSPTSRSAFNLTLDGRPSNFDYFSVSHLTRLLNIVRETLPDAHVDFGWTPNQSHPSRRYVETLKEYGAGFAWHGFLRHIDHRTIMNPAEELAAGREQVEAITRRFGVRFQPVMIFPYGQDNPDCIELLQRSGFRAKAQNGATSHSNGNGHPEYLRLSKPERIAGVAEFTVLHRTTMEKLTRNRMLAQSALGLPVLALAYPEDLALARFRPSRWPGDSFAELRRVLEFAANKTLRPLSLEQIAGEQMAAS